MTERAKRAPAFGTPLLVRCESVRVVGAKHGTEYVYRQKPLDRRRYVEHDFIEADEWPGIAIPEHWADTPEGWPIEPIPNGHAVLRARRLEFPAWQVGIFVGRTKLSEGVVVTGKTERGGRTGMLDERRQVEFYEVAFQPAGQGRGCIALVHPRDAKPLPKKPTTDDG